MQRWIDGAAAARLAALLLGVALLGGCSGLLPVRVQQEVPLAAVEHRAAGQPQPVGEVRAGVEGDPSRSAYADELIEADFTAESEFIRMRLHNRTDETLSIDWDRSQFVDVENVGAPLVSAGSLTVFSDKDTPVPPNVLRNTAIVVRLTRRVGDESRLGVTKPLFNVDRGSKESAQRTARELLGQRIRIVLMLEQGGTEHEYTFTFRLAEVRVEGEPVTP